MRDSFWLGVALGSAVVLLTHEQIHAITAYSLGLTIIGYSPLLWVKISPPQNINNYYGMAAVLVAMMPYLFYMVLGAIIHAWRASGTWNGINATFIIFHPWTMLLTAFLQAETPIVATILEQFGLGSTSDLTIMYWYGSTPTIILFVATSLAFLSLYLAQLITRQPLSLRKAI